MKETNVRERGSNEKRAEGMMDMCVCVCVLEMGFNGNRIFRFMKPEIAVPAPRPLTTHGAPEGGFTQGSLPRKTADSVT